MDSRTGKHKQWLIKKRSLTLVPRVSQELEEKDWGRGIFWQPFSNFLITICIRDFKVFAVIVFESVDKISQSGSIQSPESPCCKMADNLSRSKPKPLDCIVKKPVLLKVGDKELANDHKFGVSAVDVIFPGSSTVEVGKLTFKNCYTASITVKLKVLEDTGNETWKTAVKNYTLMPYPHFESGSQDHFTIFITNDIMKPSSQVIMLRLILKQPSPHWSNFSIEEVKCFPLANTSNTLVPGWLQSIECNNQTAIKSSQNFPNSDNVASSIQQLWAIVQELKSSKHSATIGRFDIDGSYDINLLSYT